MYTYEWNISRCWPSYYARIYEGSIAMGTYRKIWEGEFMRRKNAMKELRKALNRDMNFRNVWRVSEGGNSPVSNNYSVKPYIRGIIMPNGEEMAPYDYWPSSWGREPTRDEMEGKESSDYI